MRVTRHDGIALLTIGHPPVNALSAVVRVALGKAIRCADADDAVSAIVIACAGKTFIAGADIKEFGTPAEAVTPDIFALQDLLVSSSKLTVAAIHGTALGGGLELALCCAARIAVSSASVGLPEVELGLLAGAGGTQRLTRLVGPDRALEIMVSGRRVPAQEALALGIVDAIVPDIGDGALAFVRAALASGRRFVPILDRDMAIQDLPPTLFAEWRNKAARDRPGAEAPQRIVDCVEAAVTLPASDGFAVERAAVAELFAGAQHAELKRRFFAERRTRQGFDPANRAAS